MKERLSRILIVTGTTGFLGMNFLEQMNNYVEEITDSYDVVFLINKYGHVSKWNEKRHKKLARDLRKKSEERNTKIETYLNFDLSTHNRIMSIPMHEQLFSLYPRIKGEECEKVDIINFAAESHVDNSIKSPYNVIQNNVNLILCLLNTINYVVEEGNATVRLQHISTDEVYGELNGDRIFTLDSKINPRNPYSASKAAQEHFVQSWYNTYDNFTYRIYRLSNVFGKYQYPEKLIPVSVKRAIQDGVITLQGNGRAKRQWSYAPESVNRIIWDLVNNTELDNHIKHIADGGAYCFITNNKLIDEYIVPCLSEFGLHPSVEYVEDRPGHDMGYRLESTPYGTIDDFQIAIRDTVSWYVRLFEDD